MGDSSESTPKTPATSTSAANAKKPLQLSSKAAEFVPTFGSAPKPVVAPTPTPPSSYQGQEFIPGQYASNNYNSGYNAYNQQPQGNFGYPQYANRGGYPQNNYQQK